MFETLAHPSSDGFLITGGSGLVGQAIARELARRGLRVLLAARADSGEQDIGEVKAERHTWDPHAVHPFPDTSPIEGLAAAIHLSGANLAARRWTPGYKRQIVLSRTETTAAIVRTLAGLRRPPSVLITASATGIYGDRGDEVLTEASAHGQDFLSKTCEAWEASAEPAVVAGIRVVHLRFGVVLTPEGGALAKVLPLFRLGLGGRLGSGQQWMSWVALEDVVRGVLFLAGLPDEVNAPSSPGTALRGPVNCITPAPVTNKAYTRALGRVLHRPAITPAPAFALRLALGEMADAALLSSCRALPEKLLAGGFRFQYPEIEAALAHMLGR